jgi:hypothetical protein
MLAWIVATDHCAFMPAALRSTGQPLVISGGLLAMMLWQLQMVAVWLQLGKDIVQWQTLCRNAWNGKDIIIFRPQYAFHGRCTTAATKEPQLLQQGCASSHLPVGLQPLCGWHACAAFCRML